MKRWVKIVGAGMIAAVALGLLGGVLWSVANGYKLSAERARIVYDDLERFERVLAALPPEQSEWPRFLNEVYVDEGTKGLRAFTQAYGLHGDELARMLSQDVEGWLACSLGRNVRAFEPEIRRGLTNFGALYPRAIFPPIYFVVGHERAGGMNKAAGVVVSAEIYRGDLPGCDFGASRMGRSSQEIPCLVVHELVHFNHARNRPITYFREWNNLARAIKEGAADFLAELAVGCHINQEAHAWGRSREAELWSEFQHVLESSDTGDWFWVDPDGDRPQDVGYFIGYNIVRAFYEGAAEKKEAVRRIMNVADYRAFLAESGYSGGS